MKRTLFLAVMAAAALSFFLPSQSNATRPSDYGLKEGDLISAIFSDDPDVYIINEYGFKRLFLNPEIFKFYAHLGGFASVKLVTPEIRDSFPTSGFFRNCEDNDQKVFGTSVEGEDQGRLHWINKSGEQAVQEDADFFKKVFCINRKEFNWYPRGSEFRALKEVPEYKRKEDPTPYVICHHPTDEPKTFQTIRVAAEALDAHFQHGDDKGACPTTFSTPAPVLTPAPIPTTSNPIVLISPNGGEWKMGQTYEIRWKQIENAPVTIELQNKQLTEGYLPWYKIALANATGAAGENIYKWAIPANLNPHTGYEICVQGFFTNNVGTTSAASTFKDCSEPPFYVSGIEEIRPIPFVTVISPNGGEVLQKGITQLIKWNSANVSKIYIKLRKGNDTYPGPEGMITDVITNAGGYFKWTPPTTLSDGNDYAVRVIDGNFTGVLDDSDKPFSIVSTATISYFPTPTPVYTPTPTAAPSYSPTPAPAPISSSTQANLSVSSTPSGATVTNINTGYVYCQSTPCNVQVAVPPNSANIRISKSGYYDWTNLIYLYAGQTTYVNASLSAISTPTPSSTPAIRPPTVSLYASSANVVASQPFTLTIGGTSDIGLAAVWWYGQNTGVTNAAVTNSYPLAPTSTAMFTTPVTNPMNLDRAFGSPLFTAAQAVKSYTFTSTVIIPTPGTYTLGANSRDVLYPKAGEPHQASEGAGLAHVSVNVVLASSSYSPTPIPTPTPTPATTAGSGNSFLSVQRLFIGQYDNTKYSFTVNDPDGIKEFLVEKTDGIDLFGGGPSCLTSVTSGTVTINPSDFPLQGYVIDCANPSIQYQVQASMPTLSTNNFMIWPIARDLYRGIIGNDVKQLQAFLVNEVSFPSDLLTGYFGSITQNAVKKLQEKYNVRPVSGYFGKITRKALRALISN